MKNKCGLIGLFISITVSAYAGSFTYGDKSYTTKDWPISDGMVRFYYHGKWGFADGKTMKVLIPPEYLAVSHFNNGKALVLTKLVTDSVHIDLAWIDKKGKETPFDLSIPSKIEGEIPVYYSAGDTLYVLSQNGVNLRESPSLDGTKVTNVPHGCKVTILENPLPANMWTTDKISGYWVKVEAMGKTGWLFDGFLSLYAPVNLKTPDDAWKLPGMIFHLSQCEKTELKGFIDFDNPYNIFNSSVTVYRLKNSRIIGLELGYGGGVTTYYFLYGIRPFEVFQHFKAAGVIPESSKYPGDGQSYDIDINGYEWIKVLVNPDGVLTVGYFSAD
ncbi:MAG: SH3 domain-containing protein [Brevinematales bacterium]|nr:SH3 domain-containing protein [Brevinematales bacterium]